MRFLDRDILPSSCIRHQDIVRRIRLRRGRPIVLVASEDAVGGRKSMIQPSCSEVLRRDVGGSKRVKTGIAVVKNWGVRHIGQTPQTKKREYRLINSRRRIGIDGTRNPVRSASPVLWVGTKYAHARRGRGDGVLGAEGLVLATPFVIREEKRVILPDRTAERRSELISAE